MPLNHPGIERIKAAVRERDGHRCARCGRTSDESRELFGCQLTVHRVVPQSRYSAEPGVCMTLCKSCHSRYYPVAPHHRLCRTKTGRRLVLVRPNAENIGPDAPADDA